MAKLSKKEKATIERQMAVTPVRSETWVGIRPTIYKSGKANEVLREISKGNIKVKWDSWSFSGGRDYGNWDAFTLSKDGNEYGRIELNDAEGVTIIVDGETLCYEEDNQFFWDKADKILTDALRRDDAEFVAKISNESGMIFMPRDNGDISREDVLSGRYVVNNP